MPRAVVPVMSLTPSGRRMRLHRERRRDGMRCLTVEVHDSEVDALVRRGFLAAEARHDANAIADAFYAHLERTLR
jgi:hypothetical protein